MVLTSEKISQLQRTALSLMSLPVIFNVSAFLITVYMLINFSGIVYETNPIPAMIFSNYGYATMALVMVGIWALVFSMIKVWGKILGPKRQLILTIMLVLVITPITFIDFANNMYYLFMLI